MKVSNIKDDDVSTDQLIKDVSELLGEDEEEEEEEEERREEEKKEREEEEEEEEGKEEKEEKRDIETGIIQDADDNNIGIRFDYTTLVGLVMLMKPIFFTMLIVFYNASGYFGPKKTYMVVWNTCLLIFLLHGHFYYRLVYLYRGVKGTEYVLYNAGLDVLKFSVFYNLFLSFWLLTFFFHVLEEVYLNYSICMFISLLHIFVTGWFISVRKGWVIPMIHLILFMMIPINDPISVGANSAAKRSILSTIIFFIDVYIYKIGCRQKYTEIMLINVVVPIWKADAILAYIYFVCYLAFRIFNIRKFGKEFSLTRAEIISCSGVYFNNAMLKKTDLIPPSSRERGGYKKTPNNDFNMSDDEDESSSPSPPPPTVSSSLSLSNARKKRNVRFNVNVKEHRYDNDTPEEGVGMGPSFYNTRSIHQIPTVSALAPPPPPPPLVNPSNNLSAFPSVVDFYKY